MANAFPTNVGAVAAGADPASQLIMSLMASASASAAQPNAASDVKVAPKLTAEQKQERLADFMDTLEQLLQALKLKFPHCPAIEEQCDEFLMVAKPTAALHEKLIAKWHDQMKRHYVAIEAGEVAPVLQDQSNKLFIKLRMIEKWNDPKFSAQDKQSLLSAESQRRQAETELARRAEHALRDLAPQLRLTDLRPVRERRAHRREKRR